MQSEILKLHLSILDLLLVLEVLALRLGVDWLMGVHGTLILHGCSLMKLSILYLLATQIHIHLLRLLDCVALIHVVRILLMKHLVCNLRMDLRVDLRADLCIHLWVDLWTRQWTLLTNVMQALLTLQ